MVAGVILTLGAKVMQEARDDIDGASSSLAANESSAMSTNTTTVTLSHVDVVSPLKIYNNTNYTMGVGGNEGDYLIENANFTINYKKGTVVMKTLNFNQSNVTFSYSYYNRNTAYLAAENATQGIGKMAKYMPLMALVLAAAIIIGIVLISFGAGKGPGPTGGGGGGGFRDFEIGGITFTR